ncbi:hypothetical protein LTR08_002770 [Meristemomyces frigidus]|nr:hypothetical protein LTR08_002770 [Meristemomyces frigidus]
MANEHAPSSASPAIELESPPPTDPAASFLRPRERPRPSDRVPSFANNRMSHSRRSSRSRSRPPSTSAFPAFSSSLHYSAVRDFAYPLFHPMHYGAPPDLPTSGATTPGSDWNASGRRSSDPMRESGSGGGGSWSAGPWGGDGGMFDEPLQGDEDEDAPSLPRTSFTDDDDEAADTAGASSSAAGKRKSGSGKKHRKSKSYANYSDYERGRRRESGGGSNANANTSQGFRRSRASGDAAELAHFSGQQTDPAGRDALRQSRLGQSTVGEEGRRRDSHFQTMLQNRSLAAAQQQQQTAQPARDVDSDLPLDAEVPTSPSRSYSPQRQSIGPEDEELYAGQSLALYSFEPENANELRLREGQVILVSYRHGQGWLVAEDPHTGEQGLVPEEYVRLVSELEGFDAERGEFREEGEESEVEVEVEVEEGEGEEEEEGEGEGVELELNEGFQVTGTTGQEVPHRLKEMRVDEAHDYPAEVDAKHVTGKNP